MGLWLRPLSGVRAARRRLGALERRARGAGGFPQSGARNDTKLNPDEFAQLGRLYPVLGRLALEQRRKLQAQAQVVHVPQGTVIFDERQPCAGFPFLLQGGIRVRKSAASGRELPLYRVLPGESCVISSSCLLGHTDYN